MMWSHILVLGTLLVLAPLGAKAADLVVWWDQGANPEEDAAIGEVTATFERKTGKQVELVLHEQAEHEDKLVAAIEAGQPPDIASGIFIDDHIPEWAFRGQLVDLTDTVGSFSDLFDRDALAWFMLLNQKTQQRALYALPVARTSNYVHVWKSLLERAGFTLADVPKEWEAFWAFWCDQVQPAVRRATGRDDIWGVGLNMSGKGDTEVQVRQFGDAYGADYVTRDGRLVIDDPEVRRKLIKTIDAYSTVYRKGCTPPDAVTWDGFGNNKAFLAQAVVMTPNDTLSIPNTL
jgi:multiple sugar transport system substrate-binding protein